MNTMSNTFLVNLYLKTQSLKQMTFSKLGICWDGSSKWQYYMPRRSQWKACIFALVSSCLFCLCWEYFNPTGEPWPYYPSLVPANTLAPGTLLFLVHLTHQGKIDVFFFIYLPYKHNNSKGISSWRFCSSRQPDRT